MSYDVWLSIETGHGHELQVKDFGNYTSNVSIMWDKACEAVGSPDLRNLEGESAGDVAPKLLEAARWLVANKDAMLPLEPENKWGSYKGAVKYFGRIAAGCREHPNCVLRMSI